MSINDITLPGAAVAALYRTSLVQLNGVTGAEKAEPRPEAKPAVPVSFLGNNAKNILVFVNYPDISYLPENQLAFLSSILKACQLSINDIAIINLAKTPQSMDHFVEALKPVSMLIFGPQANSFTSIKLTHFIVVYINGISVLGAPTLENFDPQNPDSKSNKSQLWNSLKLVFNL